MPVTSITPYSVPKANKNLSTRERNQEQSANSVSFGSSSSINGVTMRKASLAMAAMGAALIALSGCTGGSSPNGVDPNPADTTELSSSSSDTTAIDLPSSSSAADTTKSSSSADTAATDTTKSSSSVADTSKSSSSVADTTKSSSSSVEASSSSSTTAASSSSAEVSDSPAMQDLKNQFDFLGITQSSKASALAKTAYTAKSGDIQQYNYTYDFYNYSTEEVLNVDKSSADTLVYDYKETDNATGDVSNGTMSYTKTKEGLLIKDSERSYSVLRVQMNDYIMEYAISADGSKKECGRLYPMFNGKITETAADGTNPKTLSNFNVIIK